MAIYVCSRTLSSVHRVDLYREVYYSIYKLLFIEIPGNFGRSNWAERFELVERKLGTSYPWSRELSPGLLWLLYWKGKKHTFSSPGPDIQIKIKINPFSIHFIFLFRCRSRDTTVSLSGFAYFLPLFY